MNMELLKITFIDAQHNIGEHKQHVHQCEWAFIISV